MIYKKNKIIVNGKRYLITSSYTELNILSLSFAKKKSSGESALMFVKVLLLI